VPPPTTPTTYRANSTNRSGSDRLPYAERPQAPVSRYPTEISPLLPGPHAGGADPVGRFLIWLSGARQQILAECPTEQPKYIGLGISILIPAAMAAVSLAFALITALRAELLVALLFAAAWAMVMVSLDRMFVVSLPRTGTWQAQLFRATPRFLLALLLGLVISTPFVLQIFRPEIVHQVTILHDQAASVYYQQLKTSPLTQQIDQDTAMVSNLETEAAGGGVGSAQNVLESLLKQRSQAEALQTSDLNKWQCELYGAVPGGQVCNASGDGPLAQADAQRYHTDVAQVRGRAELTSDARRVVIKWAWWLAWR
jgi:hypothetical protein